MRKVYVAGKMTAKKEVQRVQRLVKDRGGIITFDWTGPEGKTQRDWHHDPAGARRIAQTERDAVEEADLLILVNWERGLGMYIEAGMALLQRKPVLLWGKTCDSVFFHLDEIDYVEEEKTLISWLDTWFDFAHDEDI